MRKLSVGTGVVLLAVTMTACGAREQAEPNPPSTTPNVSIEPDTSQPVASGNTPAAADIAAVAALSASFDPLRDPASDLETAKVEAMRGGKRIMLDVGGSGAAGATSSTSSSKRMRRSAASATPTMSG